MSGDDTGTLSPRSVGVSVRFYAMPLARHGFIPRDPISNPIRYYIEDETGKILPNLSFNTLAEADEHAANLNNPRGARQ